MRIRNHYNEAVFWRAFNFNDTIYHIGLKQGKVEKGQTDKWIDDSFPKIKVEAKTGDIVFSKKVLSWAGKIFNMSDDILITKDGNLEVAKVGFTPKSPEIIRETELLFVDLRKFDTQVERTLTSKMENVFSTSTKLEQSLKHQKGQKIGGKLGGAIGTKNALGANAEVSAEFSSTVSQAFIDSYAETVKHAWSTGWSDTFRLDPKKIYVMEILWELTIRKGVANYFGEAADYKVIQKAEGKLVRPLRFDDIETMRKEQPKYAEEFERLENARDGENLTGAATFGSFGSFRVGAS